MRRTGYKLKLEKKKRRRKHDSRIKTVSCCDHCKTEFQVCRARIPSSVEFARKAGVPVAFRKGVPYFFCSATCLKEFEAEIPFEVPF